ncbi:MAG: hypothetical protein NUV77_22115 [Thermoguttaceae bacterium]|nr:hypothetical protein [Thermoguttaceae bacterium]
MATPRVRIIGTVLCAWLFGSMPLPAGAAADPLAGPFVLSGQPTTGRIDRVEVSLEVGGDLKLAGSGGESKPVTEKLGITARLVYDEKCLEVPSDGDRPLRALRYYDQIDVANKVGDRSFQPGLRDGRRLMAVEVRGTRASVFSPNGTLTRDELDLVDLPGNSLLVDRLLPGKPVALHDSWKPQPEVIAALCGLDAAARCDVTSELVSVTDATAKFEMSGNLSGTVAGASTRIELKAKYRLDRKTGRIDWFAMALKEERAVGPVGPGLSVIANLQMKITPIEDSSHFDDEAAKGLSWDSAEDLKRLRYVSLGGGWELAHDRRWVVVTEKGDSAVLRMADQGEYVAQCSITSTAASANEPISLSQFQDEIRQALGKHFGQFVRAAQSPGEAGYQIYRVEVEGAVADVPVQWIYTMVLDGQNRRAVLAFVVQGEMAKRFGQADQDLVRSLRFVDAKVAATR